ncbi:MAG TPA: HIT family protein [Burkholderiaceae bacterium]
MTAQQRDRGGARAARGGAPGCPLCEGEGGEVVWRDRKLRVILPDEPDYPGFTRVVWAAHVAEMTDLAPADRNRLMEVVWRVERAQRAVFAPHKINLASLGNVVAHLHWHVIPRWRDDRHFPQPVWGTPAPDRDEPARRRRDAARGCLEAYRGALAAACAPR